LVKFLRLRLGWRILPLVLVGCSVRWNLPFLPLRYVGRPFVVRSLDATVFCWLFYLVAVICYLPFPHTTTWLHLRLLRMVVPAVSTWSFRCPWPSPVPLHSTCLPLYLLLLIRLLLWVGYGSVHEFFFGGPGSFCTLFTRCSSTGRMLHFHACLPVDFLSSPFSFRVWLILLFSFGTTVTLVFHRS